MGAKTKIFIGLGLTAIAYWALTTKNEVVESIVFPVKVKLGLAKRKEPVSLVPEKKSIWTKYEDNLPSIFKKTIYRLPTAEELKEVDERKMSADDIRQGFSYTIIGRGVKSPKNEAMIKESITMLSEMFPENTEYKEALNKSL